MSKAFLGVLFRICIKQPSCAHRLQRRSTSTAPPSGSSPPGETLRQSSATAQAIAMRGIGTCEARSSSAISGSCHRSGSVLHTSVAGRVSYSSRCPQQPTRTSTGRCTQTWRPEPCASRSLFTHPLEKLDVGSCLRICGQRQRVQTPAEPTARLRHRQRAHTPVGALRRVAALQTTSVRKQGSWLVRIQ